MPKLTEVKVSLSLPYIGEIVGTWEPEESEKNAAWEMYVELVTRISVTELKSEEGLLRGALSSLHTLFETTRSILRKYGPAIARPKAENSISFGYLAVAILNTVLRPVLAKWHPLLLECESTDNNAHSPLEREKLWEKHDELREDLNDVRAMLLEYASLLAQVAGVPSLVVDRND
jgi:hypothetical protein